MTAPSSPTASVSSSGQPTPRDSPEDSRRREEIETRVIERTSELEAANGMLRDELLEFRRDEAEREALVAQLVAAQEKERQRISRDLHDEVGQNLAALMLGLKQLRDSLGPEAQPAILELQRVAETIGKSVHDLALELRPTALDDLGLIRTLANFVENWSARTQITVDFHHAGESTRLPAVIETTLYRIVQEAFNNVFKHARARRVSLIIERRVDQAIAIIEDDGSGFETTAPQQHSGRLGIAGMRERAVLVGGEFNLESSPGRGTTVFVRIPLRPDTKGSRRG